MGSPNFPPGRYDISISSSSMPSAPGPERPHSQSIFHIGPTQTPGSYHPRYNYEQTAAYNNGVQVAFEMPTSDPGQLNSQYHQSRFPRPEQYPVPHQFGPPAMYHGPSQPPLASGPFQNQPIPPNTHADHAGLQFGNGPHIPRVMEPNINHGHPPVHFGMQQQYPYPSYPDAGTAQAIPRLPPQMNRMSDVRRPPVGDPFTVHGTRNYNARLGPPWSQQQRRPSIDRQPHELQLQQEQAPSMRGLDRRPPPYVPNHSRRTDLSVSPRPSNRRNFERYSTDLPRSGAADVNEAAGHQRHPQRRRTRDRNHVAVPQRPHHTPGQLQALKDKLRHFVPSQLPKGTSSCCDICQKEYSVKYCDPTEEEEVAIQLPCKHFFGEHCINTWFETCQTYKNKITCPMCRELLVEEAPPNRAAYLHSMSAMPSMMMMDLLGRSPSSMTAHEHEQLMALIALSRGGASQSEDAPGHRARY